MSDILKDITPLTCEEHELCTGYSSIIYDKKGISIEGHNDLATCQAIVTACNAFPDLVAALETAESDCQLAINVLGNNGPEFDSVRRSFAIIRDRITLALYKVQQS